MLEKKALEELRKMENWTDFEKAHSRADEILTSLLREWGFGKVCDAYDKIGKWYA